MNFLFLDDNPQRIKQVKSIIPSGHYVTTAMDAIVLIPQLHWDVISLDHDLENKEFMDSDRLNSGMEVVRFLCGRKREHRRGYGDVEEIIIHSFNPVASERMIEELRQADYIVKSHPFSVEIYRMIAEYDNL